ncbi:MerR family transcriptional regulator [Profundibacter sp.]
MAKSADAFRTISEVAEWLDTPAHVLRFWESRFSQVKPVKRAGGRRYYRPNDMLLLGGIKKLLHEDGITIKGVQKLLRTDGVKKISALSQMIDADDGDVIDIKSQAPVLEDASPITTPTPETIPPDTPPSLSVVASDEPEEELTPEIEPEPEIEPQPEPEIEPQPEPEIEPQPEPEIIPDPVPAPPLEPGTIEASPAPESNKDTEQLSAIFSRLSTLHERMKSDIGPK